MRALARGRVACGRRPLTAGFAFMAILNGLSCSAHKERVVDLGGGVKMSFVLIPAGTFTMGSKDDELEAVSQKWPELEVVLVNVGGVSIRDEKPGHKVTISKAFWMGKHEVTAGQFRRFVETTGYKTDAEKGKAREGALVGTQGNLKFAGDASWRNPYFKQSDDHPVACVSWNDARAFADWLNATQEARPAGTSYRLPTEAEWEYACRAGSTTWYQWGDDPDKGNGWCNGADLATKKAFPKRIVCDWELAYFCDAPSWSGFIACVGRGFSWHDGFVYTAPVGSFKANAFGLHDMHGNVSEWCDDWYGAYTYQEAAQADPKGPTAGGPHVVRLGSRMTLTYDAIVGGASGARVFRGGSWGDSPGRLRCAAREHIFPTARSNMIGFRLVLAPEL